MPGAAARSGPSAAGRRSSNSGGPDSTFSQLDSEYVGHQEDAEQDDGRGLEHDRDHDRLAVSVLHESEQAAALADQEPGERARRDADAADREQRQHGIGPETRN